MDDRRLYETILGLPAPWYVAEVAVRAEPLHGVVRGLAIRLLRETTLSDLAELMGLSWDDAEAILDRAVARGLSGGPQMNPR